MGLLIATPLSSTKKTQFRIFLWICQGGMEKKDLTRKSMKPRTEKV
jgi:hypothetical protein